MSIGLFVISILVVIIEVMLVIALVNRNKWSVGTVVVWLYLGVFTNFVLFLKFVMWLAKAEFWTIKIF